MDLRERALIGSSAAARFAKAIVGPTVAPGFPAAAPAVDDDGVINSAALTLDMLSLAHRRS